MFATGVFSQRGRRDQQMCNAWNHSAGCTCGWGGEGHLGSSSGGNFGYYTAPAPLRSWDLERDTGTLSHRTACWWCGAPVFFHRSETGGCVLFDELRPPWPVHSCWQIHSSDRATGLSRVEKELAELSYTGKYYKATALWRVVPDRKGNLVGVNGFVSDNHFCYLPSRRQYLPASRTGRAGAVIRIEVLSSNQTVFPFHVPEGVAQQINNFDAVSVRGRWHKRRGRWLLLATHFTVWRAGEANGIHWKPFPDNVVVSCSHCGIRMKEKDVWGLDPDYAVECGACGAARGRLSSDEFKSLCRRVVKEDRRRTRASA